MRFFTPPNAPRPAQGDYGTVTHHTRIFTNTNPALLQADADALFAALEALPSQLPRIVSIQHNVVSPQDFVSVHTMFVHYTLAEA